MRGKIKVRHLILAIMCLLYFVAYIDRVNISVAGPVHPQGIQPHAD